MSKHKWNYCGDINIEHGGYFWREDGADDYVLVVRVQPCSDGGGADNLYSIEQGSLYIPDDAAELKRALDCCGWFKEGETPTRAMVVDSLIAYRGIDQDSMNGETIVRRGPKEETRRDGWNPEPQVILRSNASLENYVKNHYLD